MVTPIKHKTAQALLAAFKLQMSTYASRGFELTMAFFDGEGGLAAIDGELRQAGVETSPMRGSHAAYIENRHRTIKNRMRTEMAYAAFPLWRQLICPLLFYCLSRINSSPCVFRPHGASARELFLGRKLSFKKELQTGFCDYVMVHVPNVVKNSLAPRTEAALTLYPTGSVQGSWKVLLLKSGTIVTRDRVTPRPMPDDLLAYLKKIGMDQRKKFPATPLFRIGTVPIEDLDPDDEPFAGDQQGEANVATRIAAGGEPADREAGEQGCWTPSATGR
jgi:hypothetical protein